MFIVKGHNDSSCSGTIKSLVFLTKAVPSKDTESPKNSVSFKYMASLFSGLAFLFCGMVSANEHRVGDITIHYNALSSALIPAEVAAQYHITRSNRTGLINITVMKNDVPVIANIFGNGKNLTGQLKELAFKEIKEENAIYYIATFNYANGEQLSFDLKIQAEKKGQLLPLQFKQQLFSE